MALDLSKILSEFAHVFKELARLLPMRSHDHRIPLLPNQLPVNARPYRYPHHQKIEIENLVKEFLKTLIIWPSWSLISSLVLLIKNLDGSWRFYVGY
jgi:hypothetical protein